MHLASVDEGRRRTSGMPREDLAARWRSMASRDLLLFRRVEEDGNREGTVCFRRLVRFPAVVLLGRRRIGARLEMAGMVAKYFNREMTKEAYAGCPTKAYRMSRSTTRS